MTSNAREFAERIKALGFDRISGTYGRDTLAGMIEVRDTQLQNEARVLAIREAGGLKQALENLVTACLDADSHEELSELVDGLLLDQAKERLEHWNLLLSTSHAEALTAYNKRVRLEERMMCAFHEYGEGCTCFHCRRIAELRAEPPSESGEGQ